MSHNITVKGGTSVRLPTAGKYCDRDIIVTAEGGGLALDVVTATALPSAVVDGQIVVITDTTPGTVYIDTDEPASPADGDLWIEVAAGGDAALVLTEESPYLRNGLVVANQWTGTAWQTYDGHIGVDGAWVQFSSNLPPIGTALNDLSWEEIAAIAASGKADKYFSVGDAKQIYMTGSVGNISLTGYAAWAFIVGIYHDSEREGGKYITFQLFKSAQTGGSNLAFIDDKYGTMPGGAKYFVMNQTNTNSGGWEGCTMRTTILNNQMKAALPSDLKAVLKSVKKYTDNTGGTGGAESAVTATEDYLWLPSEYELLGERTYANAHEMKYQKQYDYYASGNSAVFYRHLATSTAAKIWMRSHNVSGAANFCITSTAGGAAQTGAGYSQGCAPMFCV